MLNLLIIVVGSIVASAINVTLPFFITKAIGFLPFYAVGNMLRMPYKCYDDISVRYRIVQTFFAIVVITSITVWELTCIKISSHENAMEYVSHFTVGVTMTVTLYILLKWFPEYKMLSYIGQNTLAIMCLHEPLKRIVIQLFAVVLGQSTDMTREDVLLSVTISIVVTVLLLPVVWGVNRYVPWMVGKKSLQNK